MEWRGWELQSLQGPKRLLYWHERKERGRKGPGVSVKKELSFYKGLELQKTNAQQFLKGKYGSSNWSWYTDADYY